MGIKKSIKKLFSEPNEMRLEEVSNILNYYGYRKHGIVGSHYQFKRKGYGLITVPAHNNKVQKIYLKLLKRTIIKYFICLI